MHNILYNRQEMHARTHMRGDKICNQIERYSPPDSTKNVAREVLHSAQEVNRVVDLW